MNRLHLPHPATRPIGLAILFLALPLVSCNSNNNSSPQATAPNAAVAALPAVNGNQIVVLDGSGSTDPQGQALSFLWTQLSGTPVALSGTDKPKASFLTPNENVLLRFRLTVTDNNQETGTSEVDVQVLSSGVPLVFSRLASIPVAGGGEGKAEISAYHAPSKRLFTISSQGARLDAFDLSDPANPVAVGELLFGPDYAPNSVAAGQNFVAVALEAVPNTGAGLLQLVDPDSLTLLGTAPAGALPDMVAISPDQRFVLLCNEGQPNLADYSENPEGSLTLVELDGTNVLNTTQISFSAFNMGKATAADKGVRLDPNPAVSLAQDLEPEYAVFSEDSKLAWITLQENNSVLVLDVDQALPIGLFSLGTKDWNSAGLDRPAKLEFFPFSNLPELGTTAAGQTLTLGGFSGLCFLGETPEGRLRFVTVPDRGPQLDVLDVDSDGEAERPFPLPGYQARIVPFELDPATGAILLLPQIPLVRADGVTPISGLPNLLATAPGLANYDEVPVDLFGTELALDPFGGDFEGLLVDGDGHFWLCDEYRPSIYEFDATGQLLRRLVPKGANGFSDGQGGTIQVGTDDSLPAIYGTRRVNRGFEALALDSDRGLLAAFIQSPLDNPDTANDASSKAAVFGRILEIDPQSGEPVGEYLYAFDKLAGSDKIGDAVWTGEPGRYLVIERNSALGLDGVKNVYLVDVNGATNVLARPGGPDLTLLIEYGNPAILEQLGYKAASKRLVTNLTAGGYTAFEKAEGLALLPDGRLAVLNDDDFGVVGAALDTGTGLLQIPSAQQTGTALVLVELAAGGLDPSDRDDAALIAPWPVLGLPMPDAIGRFEVGGVTYLVTANEGDTREYGGNPPYVDEVRVGSGSYPLDPLTFPDAAQLKDNAVLGRLKVSNIDGDLDGDGDFDRITAFGGRSFTLWRASDGTRIYDSGSLLENLVLEIDPPLFNSQGDAASFDTRSDDKGPEPEGLAVGEIGGRPYLFVGLERPGHVLMFDVSVPIAPRFVGSMHSDSDFSPEGLEFIPADQSPTGRPILVASYEVSGTVGLWDIDLVPGASQP